MNRAGFFEELKQFYQGFYINEPVGNNVFSFEKRQNKRIYVPELIRGDLRDVDIGEEIVFSEIIDGREKNSCGLNRFVYWSHDGKDIFIFDNHHHSFSFWVFGLLTGKILEGLSLVHIDQHKDTRQPDEYLEKGFWKGKTIAESCSYANRVLNVGNFIDPALKSGMFCDLIMVDHEKAFDKNVSGSFVADIDLDIFSSEMSYIPFEKKVSFIREVIDESSFVTIATSPHFIEQSDAIKILKDIFNFPEDA